MTELQSLEVLLGGRRVGTLALTPERLCAFQYDGEWLRNGESISPFDLPLTREVYISKPRLFDGGFGVFDDSLPDGWGRLVFDRYIREKGEDPDRLSSLQLLALIGGNGRGALEYQPSIPTHSGISEFSFESFERAASRLLLDENTKDVSAETLFKYSGSAGGARPKALVKIEDKEWLIKFRAAGDSINIGQIEYEYSLLAKQCGISMPETRLFEGRYFGTQRFDRTPSGKLHVVSAAALLSADYRIPSLDYISLINACRLLTGDMREAEALFRLMVFNIAIKNRDDHAKNFAFLFNGKRWRLAPAYDILPSEGFRGFHTTTVNGSGEPNIGDIFAVAKATGIPEKTAKGIIDEVYR